jgi:hypothetical protein
MDSHVSVATKTTDPTIVDGLAALPDTPAAAAQPGASGQRQILQPAGQPPAPAGALQGVSASNDSRIGARRLPRSSSLTPSGGLRPVDSPAERSLATVKSSVSKAKCSPNGQAHSRPTHAGSHDNRTPVLLPRAWRNGAGTHPVHCASAGRAAGQAVVSTDPRLSLPPGRRGSAALAPSPNVPRAPEGREPIERKTRSSRS